VDLWSNYRLPYLCAFPVVCRLQDTGPIPSCSSSWVFSAGTRGWSGWNCGVVTAVLFFFITVLQRSSSRTSRLHLGNSVGF
jgi:hypothetical protein